ncbi:10371_t:CDS:2, partial [Scutellospora calospora]
MDTPRRKSRKPNKYVDDIGVVGRKTGVTISGEVTKNADGLEDVEAFFAAASTNPKSNFTDKITLNTDEVDEVSMSLVTDEPSQMTPLPSKNKKPKSPIPESPILDNVDNEITNEDEVSMSLITN